MVVNFHTLGIMKIINWNTGPVHERFKKIS